MSEKSLTEFMGPFRMSQEDAVKLRAQAKRNERTVAGELRYAVKVYLELAKKVNA